MGLSSHREECSRDRVEPSPWNAYKFSGMLLNKVVGYFTTRDSSQEQIITLVFVIILVELRRNQGFENNIYVYRYVYTYTLIWATNPTA